VCRHGVDDEYLYRYQQIAFGQLASLVLNMHKFGTAATMIKQIVTRLASAYRLNHKQVKMVLKDLDRRLDAENAYSGSKLSSKASKIQQTINRIIRGDVDTLRRALVSELGEEGLAVSDDQLKRSIHHAIRKFHS